MSESNPQVAGSSKSIFDAAIYSFGNVWSAVFNMLAIFVTRRFVIADAFGANNFVQSITGYFGAYNGIFRNSIGRDVPANLSLGQEEDATALVSASYTLLIISLIIQSTLLLALAALADNYLIKLAFLTSAFFNLFDSIAITDRIFMRALQRFQKMAVSELISGILSPSLLVFLSWFLGFKGYFLGIAVSGIIRFISFRLIGIQGFLTFLKWNLQKKAIKQVLTTGISISLLTIIGQALLTADRWVIIHSFGTADLGYYSLGSAIVVSVGIIPSSIAGSYFSTLMRHVAMGQLDRVRSSSRKIQAIVTLALVLLFGTIAIVITPVIKTFLPKYESAILVFQVLFFQGYFYGSQVVPLQLHIAFNKLKVATLITAVGVCLVFLLSMLLISYGLVGIAVASTVAFGAYVILISWAADRCISGQYLLVHALLGQILLGGLYILLFTFGPIAALVYLIGIGGATIGYVARLLRIDWRMLSASAKAYFASIE